MAVIQMLRREGCGGATAIRGIAGFGASSLIHTSAVLRLSMDMPIVIVVIDRPEKIERVMGNLREIAPKALIIADDVEILQSGGAAFKEGLPDVTVEEVMRHEVATVHPDDPVTAVVELLLNRNFTAVPVVDNDGRVTGMVSDSDLLTRGGMNVAISLKRAADADYVRELHDSLESSQRKVGEVMTGEVVTITPDTPLGQAARLMVDRHIKRLPVVGAGGRLVGILGRLDVLNTIAAVHLPEWHPDVRAVGGQATVAEVMTRDVPALSEPATIEQIFEALVSSAHKRVVIVDDRKRVVGIVADSDLIARVSRESWPGIVEILAAKVPIERISAGARQHIQKLRARTARELMTRDVITVRDKMPVASALALSAEKRVKRLPVVDAEGELVGIVGRTEMMRALLG
jgi:CBS domain-containing protein